MTTMSEGGRRRFVTFYIPRVRLLVAIGRIFTASTASGTRRTPGQGSDHYSAQFGEVGIHVVRFTWR